MKLFRVISILVLALSLLLSSTLPVAADQKDSNDFATDRILVQFKDGVDKATKDNTHGKNGGKVVSENTKLGLQVVQVAQGKVKEKLNAYRSNNNILYAEPDFIAEVFDEPSDPYLYQQWGITDINADEAWDITAGDANIKIAILDTGIDQDHEDLMSNVSANINFSASATVDDILGHGTHVAGIVAAARNGLGVVGISYNCSIMNVKVMDDNGRGYYSSIANGITWAVDNGAKVINLSLGGSASSNVLSQAVNYAWRNGVVLVAAAGNNNYDSPIYPAYYKNTIAVAATGQDNMRASFSNYGNWVDVAAPGVYILSTVPNHGNLFDLQPGYDLLSGTSMAAPHVAGLAALIWTTSAGTDNKQVRVCIESAADNNYRTEIFCQYGKINALNSINLALQDNTDKGNVGKNGLAKGKNKNLN